MGRSQTYMDSFFSFPDIFDDMYTIGINCYGPVRQNLKKECDGTLTRRH